MLVATGSMWFSEYPPQWLASSYPQSASVTTFSGKDTRCRPTSLCTQLPRRGILRCSLQSLAIHRRFNANSPLIHRPG